MIGARIDLPDARRSRQRSSAAWSGSLFAAPRGCGFGGGRSAGPTGGCAIDSCRTVNVTGAVSCTRLPR